MRRSKKEALATEGQEGFFLTLAGDFSPSGNERGSKKIKPPEKKRVKEKKIPIERMPRRQQFAVLKGMGFSREVIKEMVFGGDWSPLRGESDGLIIEGTRDGDLEMFASERGVLSIPRNGE